MKSENNLEELDMNSRSWDKVFLSDIMDIIGGGTPKTTIEEYWNGDINWISVKDFNGDSKYITDTEKTITELGLNKSSTKLLQKNDIIISARGTVGALGMISKPMAFNQSCYGLRAKSHINSDFLFYLLKNSIRILQNNTHGSVFNTITRNTFDTIEVKVPDINEQKAIADILSSLDEKIEVNNQMNETLEEMAQALFKQWFVDFEFPNEEGQPYKSSGGEMVESELGMIPKDWKIASLKDYCTEITRGQTPKYVESSELLVLNQKVNKGRILEKQYFKFLNPDLQVPQNKYCRQWDVLLNSLGQGTLGRVHLYKEKTENVVVDQHITIIRNDKFASIYLYNLLSTSQYQGRLDSLVSGSTGMLMLNISKIREMCILSPSYELVVKFGQILESTYENIATNEYINEKLVHIRDSLLPKLMSGEIRVSELES